MAEWRNVIRLGRKGKNVPFYGRGGGGDSSTAARKNTGPSLRMTGEFENEDKVRGDCDILEERLVQQKKLKVLV